VSARREPVVDHSPDVEMRAGPDDHDALRVWLRLLATTKLIEARVRGRLQDRYATTLPRFDFMAQLYRVPQGLKMSELSARMMVTNGNVTGIADALEKEGLVRRAADPADGRALRVRLTGPGRNYFRAMAEAHERWIVEALSGVDRNELRMLNSLLANVKSSVRALNHPGD
jgi:DNA-binding MarR family transcriptional regulator